MRGLVTGAVTLALALSAEAAGIVFEARVDKQNQVWVDVKNPGSSPVRVRSLNVSFFDGDDRLMDQVSVDCDQDCGVAASAKESFGPIQGPRGWQAVRAMDVLFDAASTTPAQPRAPSPRPPSASPVPPTETRVGRPAGGVDWASPEAVVRGFYVALNLADLAKAREFYTRAASATAAQGFESWAKRETMDGTVTDLRLLERPDEATGAGQIEVLFADGAPAKRRVVFKKEGEGWKIERVEPVP